MGKLIAALGTSLLMGFMYYTGALIAQDLFPHEFVKKLKEKIEAKKKYESEDVVC